MTRRIYTTGSRWAFWRWTEFAGGYISRLILALTPWFSVFLHWIHGPDPQPYSHDHPVTFLSIILRGGYTEERGDHWPASQRVIKRHRWFNFIRSTDRHRIIEVEPGTVTLCFATKRLRTWGFHVPDAEYGGTRWVDWKTHNAARG